MRTLIAVAVALALGVAMPVPAGAAVPVLVIEGRGFGHGVGMAQDGALAMGRAGARTEQILAHFYPGTRPGRAGGVVRVPVWQSAPAKVMTAMLQFPDGGEVRDAEGGSQSPGFPVTVPRGGQVKVIWDGSRYRVEGDGVPGTGARKASAEGRADPPLQSDPADGGRPAPTTASPRQASAAQEPPPTSAPPPTTPLPPSPDPTTPEPTTPTPPTPPSTPNPGPQPSPGPGPPPAPQAASPVSGRPLWAVPGGGGTVAVPARSRRYRGAIEATAATGVLRLVNKVDVEQYLRGMGEVLNPSWPPASLRAQAIAARTYALRAMAAAGEICETQRCQVYLGAQAEYGAMDRAVQGTRGQVLTFGGRLASAVYSANGGGVSASPEEGFGLPTTGYPYLRPGPYATNDPLPWTVRVALTDVRARFGYRGTLTGVRVGRAGPSGRALDVVLEGSRGDQVVPGITFDAGLGLRSTLFTLRQEEAAVAPPAPPADAIIQVPPGEIGGAGGAGGALIDQALAQGAEAGSATAATSPDADAALVRPSGRPRRVAPGVVAGIAAMLLAGVTGETSRVSRRWRSLLFRASRREPGRSSPSRLFRVSRREPGPSSPSGGDPAPSPEAFGEPGPSSGADGEQGRRRP